MADLGAAAERVWYRRDALAWAARVALAPASALYGGVVRARGALYDAHVLPARPLALPALSVGNVTVGGTGKTPIAAWFTNRLRAAGATPAIVMRGVGGDEPLVHARLTGAIVVCDADRVRGVQEAARRGADVVVLDDAFQHRRARRDADVVLVSAEQGEAPAWVLPGGPYREPLSALRRASAVVVTRKSATADRAHDLARRLAAAAGVATAGVALSLDGLRAWHHDAEAPLVALRDADVLAVSAIGNPAAFGAQLAALGARVEPVTFRDHHAFSRAEAEALARRAERVGRVVCTLKDAVKLGPLWPRLGPTLWYVSQRVAVESGGDVLEDLLARLLDARAHRHASPGSGRPL